MSIENLNENIDKNIDIQIEKSTELLKEVFGDKLLGVYLYGSSIVGGLQKYSDVDLFVIVARSTTSDDREKIAKSLLEISGVYRSEEKRPIEMTIVVQSEVNPWHYPPSFDFQYGDWLRSEFESGNNEPWQTKTMPGLSLMITQLLLASRTVYGKDAGELLRSVPYNDFITALTKELDNVRSDLDWDTRNVLLTLARIWWTIETDSITSKHNAATWASEQLPEEFKPVLEMAYKSASGDQEETWDDLKDITAECADFIINKIKNKMVELETSDNSEKKISIVL